MKKITMRWAGFFALFTALICLTLPAQVISAADIMPVPHAFYGNLYHVDNTLASAGVLVTATVNGAEGGSILTTEVGQYGEADAGSPKLIVQGDFVDGDTIRFFVNGSLASPTYAFQSGAVTKLDLTYTPPTEYFFGTITNLNGTTVSAGVTVSAKVNGMDYSFTTTEAGKYGGSGPSDPKLLIQDDIADGTTITFYVNGILASPTAVFANGQTTEINLTYSSGGGGGGGGATTTTATTTTTTATPTISPVQVIVDGKVTILPVNNDGVVLVTVSESSPDNKVELIIPEGTTITVLPGTTLQAISMTPMNMDEVPPPPSGGTTIGLPYDGEPSGVTFAPPITMVWEYSDSDVPLGVNEEDLTVAYYDEALGQWVILPCVVNPETNTITVQISHFTDFIIIVPLTTTPTTPSQTATTSPATTPTSSATATPTSTTPTTTVPTQTTTAATSVTSPAVSGTGANWAVIGGAIGGVIVVALIIFFVLRRKQIAKT
jgi:hypothetical protein